MQYMELIPQSQHPLLGTDGALERRRQLSSQLPAYDQDPMKCQSLASEEEVRLRATTRNFPLVVIVAVPVDEDGSVFQLPVY